MSSWKTYAQAARNTARKQAPDIARAAEDSARRGTQKAGAYARAAGKAATEGTRESREKLAEDTAEAREKFHQGSARVTKQAPVYGKVAWRHVKEAHIGTRLLHALRDALLMGGSIAVIWGVVSATGIKIPFSIVLGLILVLMVVRFGWALFGKGGRLDQEDAEEDCEVAEDRAGADGRSWDPRDQQDHASDDQDGQTVPAGRSRRFRDRSGGREG